MWTFFLDTWAMLISIWIKYSLTCIKKNVCQKYFIVISLICIILETIFNIIRKNKYEVMEKKIYGLGPRTSRYCIGWIQTWHILVFGLDISSLAALWIVICFGLHKCLDFTKIHLAKHSWNMEVQFWTLSCLHLKVSQEKLGKTEMRKLESEKVGWIEGRQGERVQNLLGIISIYTRPPCCVRISPAWIDVFDGFSIINLSW